MSVLPTQRKEGMGKLEAGLLFNEVLNAEHKELLQGRQSRLMHYNNLVFPPHPHHSSNKHAPRVMEVHTLSGNYENKYKL